MNPVVFSLCLVSTEMAADSTKMKPNRGRKKLIPCVSKYVYEKYHKDIRKNMRRTFKNLLIISLHFGHLTVIEWPIQKFMDIRKETSVHKCTHYFSLLDGFSRKIPISCTQFNRRTVFHISMVIDTFNRKIICWSVIHIN